VTARTVAGGRDENRAFPARGNSMPVELRCETSLDAFLEAVTAGKPMREIEPILQGQSGPELSSLSVQPERSGIPDHTVNSRQRPIRKFQRHERLRRERTD